jgi:hypothetical protein
LEIYKNSIIVTPVPESDEIKEKLITFMNKGGNVIIYGIGEYLEKVKDIKAPKINVETDSPVAIREALKNFDYHIDFINYNEGKKTTTMTIANSDNALFFSLYNQTTAVDMFLKFPLGIPVFIGSDAIIENGVGKYRFTRCEHLECRAYVQQNDGVVSMREAPACNKKYRRRIIMEGLKDATVCFFPEEYCKADAVATLAKQFYGMAPVIEDCFKVVTDEKYGTYLLGEHITGNYRFYMPFKEYIK